MSSRGRLLHAWTRQVAAVVPAARVTRVRVLALFAAGIVWANAVTLDKVAAALPLGAADPSTERRLQRFLTNPGVDVATPWQPLLPILLASVGQREMVLVFDRPRTATTPRSWCWGWWCGGGCCRWPGG